jgi:hypothetical protein
MQRRKSAFWMKQLDERILEVLEVEGWSTPSILARERGFCASEGHIRERCQMLQYAGLIAPISGDMYELTIEGIHYLDGKIDARYRPWPTPGRALNR